MFPVSAATVVHEQREALLGYNRLIHSVSTQVYKIFFFYNYIIIIIW